MRSLLGLIAHNWKLKLAAFALAMLLWITVTADQVAVRWLSIPVEIELRDAEYRVAEGPLPGEVQVRISGPRREFWDLGLNPPRLRLLLQNVEEGTRSYALDPQQVQIPQRVSRGLSAVDVSPSRVTLSFVRVATASVPVQVPIESPPREGFAFVDSLQVEPATVQLSGPQPRVAAVEAVRTVPIDLAEAEGAFERTLRLDTTGLGGLELSTGTVRVSGRVERAVRQVIPDVAVESPPGVLVVPGTVDVQVWGAASIVQRLGAGDVRVRVALDSAPQEVGPGGRTTPLHVEAPPGLQAVAEPRWVNVLAAPEPPDVPGVQELEPPAPPAPAGPDTLSVPDEAAGAR